MKRFAQFALIAPMALTMVACQSTTTTSAVKPSSETVEETTTPETITIKAYDGTKTLTDITVPYDPQRIAILDMASLDIIDALGVGDRVVGSATTEIDYLQDYVPNGDTIANLGTIKTADLVEVAACEPDIIFIGGRLSSVYDDLTKIAPVVYLSTDSSIGVVESTRNNALTIASIFGLEDKVETMFDGFDQRIQVLKDMYGGTAAIVGMYSGSNFSVLGNDGRCSLIGNEIGFDNLGVGAGEVTSTHGNEASWETIVELDPSYMFFLDCNSAINSTDGNPSVQEAIENELIQQLDVYKDSHIVYLSHPDVWYTAEGGVQALDVMLQDLESALA